MQPVQDAPVSPGKLFPLNVHFLYADGQRQPQIPVIRIGQSRKGGLRIRGVPDKGKSGSRKQQPFDQAQVKPVFFRLRKVRSVRVQTGDAAADGRSVRREFVAIPAEQDSGCKDLDFNLL